MEDFLPHTLWPLQKAATTKLYPIKDLNIKVRKQADLRLNQLNCEILLVSSIPSLTCSSGIAVLRLHSPRRERKGVSQKDSQFLHRELFLFPTTGLTRGESCISPSSILDSFLSIKNKPTKEPNYFASGLSSQGKVFLRAVRWHGDLC